jgi:hypothetical protein
LPPELVIVDGAPSLEKALVALWPDTAGSYLCGCSGLTSPHDRIA